MNNSTNRNSYFAIALTSLAVILLEIAFTRILSVVLWYHWAFLCISLAMLGLGAPGVWFSVMQRSSRFLRPLLLVSSLLVPASVIAILQLGQTFRESAVLFAMVCILIPMLSLGGAICLLLMEAPGKLIGRMYGFDLLGACMGALLIVPLLVMVPTPQIIGAVGFLPLMAYMLLSPRKVLPLGLAALLAGLIVWGVPYELHYSKSYVESANRKPIYEIWTPTTRLTFFDSVFWVQDKKAGFAWGRGSKARRVTIDQYWIEQDGCAGTPMTRYRGNHEELQFLMDDVTTVGYQLRPAKRVVIIGGGGGRDILSAVISGAKDIDAVELNGQIVEAVSERFKEFSGDVYHLPGVNAVVSEGRSFLSHSQKSYDMIQISLIDSWAATSAGAFALAENNLYTLEAYRTYWRRLSDTGLLSTSRWMLGHRGVELPRLLNLAKVALEKEGVKDPAKHVAVVQGGQIGTVLVSKAPLSSVEVERLIQISQRRGFTLHYPTTGISPRRTQVATVLEQGVESFKQYGMDLSPPVDDRPFFFLVFSPFSNLDEEKLKAFGTNGAAIIALQRLIMYMAIATLVLFFLPFILTRWFRRHPGFFRGSAFFGLIGAAFMLVEIPWLQRFILFLGHPSYATTVVLACILLGAALGAMASARVGLERVQRFGLLLPIVLVIVNTLLGGFFDVALGAPLWARVMLSAVLLLPVAFLLGFFFPMGMVRFGDGNKAWFWAMNGAVGVLASVLSLALSMQFGFTLVSYMGAGLYVLAWLVLQGKAAEA